MCLTLPASVRAQSPTDPPQDPRCGPEDRERIQFLAERLEADRTYAEWWWNGFIGVFALGAVASTTFAALEDDSGKRAVYVVNATKSVIGTVRRLYNPPSAIYGSTPMAGFADCEAQREAGERLLRANAKQARRFYTWQAQATVIGMNAAGALIAGEGFGVRRRAWVSAATGIAVGELMLLLHPGRAIDDLAEYERRFGSDLASRLQVDVYPTAAGAGVQVTYRFR